MILSLIFVINLIIFCFIFYKYRHSSILFVPIVLLFIEMSRALMSGFEISNGISGIQCMVLFLYISSGYYYYFRRPRMLKLLILTLIFLAYIFTRIDFFSDFFSLSTRYLNFFLILLIFPLASSLVYRRDQIILFLNVLYNSSIVFVVYVLICSLLKIGPNMYGTGLIYGFQFEQWYFGSILVVCYPLFRRYKIRSLTNLNIVTIILILILILTLRRLTLVIIFSGLFGYFLYNFKYKFNFRLLLLTLACSLVGVALVFFTDFYKYRESRFSDDYDVENEGRYVEWFLANDAISSNGNNPMFGTANLFNEVGNYGFKKEERNMHSTYARILYGSGYLGLSIFFSIILFYVFSVLNFKRFKTKNNLYLRDLSLISFGLTFTYLFVVGTGASGLGSGVSYVVTSLIFAGIGSLKKSYYEY
jgi:O-antigen ligase